MNALLQTPFEIQAAQKLYQKQRFLPQNEFGVKIINADPKSNFNTLLLTLCSKMSRKCQTVPL